MMFNDLQFLLDEQRTKVEEVKKVLNRFKLFQQYTIKDYECAIGDIREIVG